MKPDAEISTNEAYIAAMLRNEASFATGYASGQNRILALTALCAFLMGLLLAVFLTVGWAAYEVTERITLNELRINRLEAGT